METSATPPYYPAMGADNNANPPFADLTGKTIVIYDGVCNMCTKAIDATFHAAMKEKGPDHVYIFTPLQGDFSKGVLSTTP